MADCGFLLMRFPVVGFRYTYSMPFLCKTIMTSKSMHAAATTARVPATIGTVLEAVKEGK